MFGTIKNKSLIHSFKGRPGIRAFLLLLGFVPGLFSCKKESNERSLYHSFKVVYSEETNNTEVSALFRENKEDGALTALPFNENLKVNDTILRFDPKLQRYFISFPGKRTALTFAWNDFQSLGRSQTVPLNTVFAPDTLQDTLLKDTDQVLNWLGTPLGDDEMATVRMHGYTFQQGTPGATYFRLSRELLRRMPQGPALVSAPERSRRIDYKEDNIKKGETVVIHRSRNSVVYLK